MPSNESFFDDSEDVKIGWHGWSKKDASMTNTYTSLQNTFQALEPPEESETKVDDCSSSRSGSGRIEILQDIDSPPLILNTQDNDVTYFPLSDNEELPSLRWSKSELSNNSKYANEPMESRLERVPTTGDGNCLCHAVSQALFSEDDSDLNIRNSLFNFMKRNEEPLREIWASYMKQRLGDVLIQDDEEIEVEWKTIMENSSPRAVTLNRYRYLEEIHVFALANMFKTSIIVLSDENVSSLNDGEAIQENCMRGVYVPFMWEPKKSQPIFIEFKHSHFTTLAVKSDINILALFETSPKIQFVTDMIENKEVKLSIMRRYIEEKYLGSTEFDGLSPCGIGKNK